MMIDNLPLSSPSYSSNHIFNHPNTVSTEYTSTVLNDVDDDVDVDDKYIFSAVNSHTIPVNNIAADTNKYVNNKVVSVYDAKLFLLCEQILPLRYIGKSITPTESLQIHSEAEGPLYKKFEKGVYDYDRQMPTDDSDNGWDIVIRQSTSPLPIKINAKNNGVIELEFLTGEQPLLPIINKSVCYFIENHTPVRKNEGEGGIMTL